MNRARVTRGLLLVQLVIGAAFLVRALGDVPHYPDSRELSSNATTPSGYVALAAEARFDPRRAPLYALILRTVHDAVGGPWYEGLKPERTAALPTERVRCQAPGWQTGVQVLQLLLAFGAIAVFVRACAAAASARTYAWWIGMTLALDPFLVHAQLALMPDGPAFSGCLAFLAGWIGWQRHGRLRWLALLLIGGALAAGVRPEKALVLLVTALGVAGAQLVIPALRRRRGLRRASAALAVTAALFASNLVAVDVLHERDERWSTAELVIHSRVVFPHLVELRPSLPDDLRDRITLGVARRYDDNIGNARRVVELLSGGDPTQRRELSMQLAAHALRERPGALLWDASLDSLQNLVPTPSFLVRWVGWWAAGGTPQLGVQKRFEPLILWFLFSSHDPLGAQVALASMALVIVLGGACAAWAVARRLRARRARRLATLAPDASAAAASSACDWVLPVGALLLANACAFGFTQDLFEVRYAYTGHALVMAFATWGLVAAGRGSAAPHGSTPPAHPPRDGTRAEA